MDWSFGDVDLARMRVPKLVKNGFYSARVYSAVARKAKALGMLKRKRKNEILTEKARASRLEKPCFLALRC